MNIDFKYILIFALVGCNLSTTRYWRAITKIYEDGRVALDVGNGDGLTENEFSNCVNELLEN